jgi:hypothetical protein
MGAASAARSFDWDEGQCASQGQRILPDAQRRECREKIEVYAAIWFVVAGVLFLAAPAGTSFLQRILGELILLIALIPTGLYISRRHHRAPLIECILLLYGASYGLPTFLFEPAVQVIGGRIELPSELVVRAQMYVILGMLCLLLGYLTGRSGGVRRLLPTVRLHLTPAKASRNGALVGIAALIAILLRSSGIVQIPVEFRSAYALTDGLFLLAIGVLYLVAAERRQNKWLRYLFFLLVVGRVISGLLTGMLSDLLWVMVFVVVLVWRRTRKVPWVIGVLCITVFLILQPVKSAYRQIAWYTDTSPIGALTQLPGMIVDHWRGTIDDSQTGIRESAAQSVGRFNMLAMFTHVVGLTPSTIDYVYGQTYAYLRVSMIPRVFWPDKPIAQGANDEFAIRYGLLDWSQLGRTMTGLPQLVEAYINFGVAGVAVVMFCLGLVYSTVDGLLGKSPGSPELDILYAAVMVDLLTIETNLAGVAAGLLQALVGKYLLMRYVLGCESRHARAQKPGLLRELKSA